MFCQRDRAPRTSNFFWVRLYYYYKVCGFCRLLFRFFIPTCLTHNVVACVKRWWIYDERLENSIHFSLGLFFRHFKCGVHTFFFQRIARMLRSIRQRRWIKTTVRTTALALPKTTELWGAARMSTEQRFEPLPYGPGRTVFFLKGVPFFLRYFLELTRETKCSRITRPRGIQNRSWKKSMNSSGHFFFKFWKTCPQMLNNKKWPESKKYRDDAQNAYLVHTWFAEKTNVCVQE